MQRRKASSSQSAKGNVGFVRIISGLWRGRKLPVHDAQGLRPTTDRVKETLFNWLAADIPHARCLDLFAGSGGLGFESASRQAELVTMVELNKQAYQQLVTNSNQLKANNIEIHQQDALLFLQQPGQAYDVVFIDPPFRQGLLEQTLNLLQQNGWLTENSLVYIETEKELQLPEIPEHWQLHREKTAGQVCYRLYQLATN
ncbi:16S rRNA (guanine(966)-N(2))-methyltransferase RsmD [Vibrio algivorus]|uniref:Ribosomal RNA small subunit methyltransferase D n=1 Tax=Vibrio algivorus TaxID=1667024 RepID=A0A557NXT8_9VIBR|nr:16S rRNA (guanine(966)-N(2))-methyltransferase RsmD [Vibrio algivorus]TVO33217.1 16S rRNA (guanine(966)-N(2))-methyltransferase RsmD [Vibrio algivorus]GLT13264.1 ribosomal RNA small subunit methyltransferase D [Vibrio algivorus]